MRIILSVFLLLTLYSNGMAQDTSIVYFNNNWKKTKPGKSILIQKTIQYKDFSKVEYFDSTMKLMTSGYYRDNYMDSIWIVFNPQNNNYDTLNYGGIKELFLNTEDNFLWDEIFIMVENMPGFGEKGEYGTEAFREYIAQNIHYPIRAQQNHKEGKVFIRFIVGKDGKVYGLKSIKEADTDLIFEALRVIHSSPLWKPGRQRNEAVAVMLTFPVAYALQ